MSANPTSTTDPNRFVAVFNTFKQDVLSSVPISEENTFLVPQIYGNIQEAINTALAKGYNQYDPAVIVITPDSSTGTSVTDVQFTEDLTLYDGIYIMSSIPRKRVNISGTISLGSTALGSDDLGVANTNLWYILQDLHFIDNGGGAPLLSASTNIATRIEMIRVDLTNTGVASDDNCVLISSTSIYTVNLDQCTWTTAGTNAANYCLSLMGGGVHVVTLNNRCSLNVTGAATVNCVYVQNGATMTAYDSDFKGVLLVGTTAAATLTLYRCKVTGNVASGGGVTGLVMFAANNASVCSTYFCYFVPNTHVNIFDVAGSTNIIKGSDCGWDGTTTAITAINSGAVASTSRWSGTPVPIGGAGEAAPASAIIGSLYYITAGAGTYATDTVVYVRA